MIDGHLEHEQPFT